MHGRRDDAAESVRLAHALLVRLEEMADAVENEGEGYGTEERRAKAPNARRRKVRRKGHGGSVSGGLALDRLPVDHASGLHFGLLPDPRSWLRRAAQVSFRRSRASSRSPSPPRESPGFSSRWRVV